MAAFLTWVILPCPAGCYPQLVVVSSGRSKKSPPLLVDKLRWGLYAGFGISMAGVGANNVPMVLAGACLALVCAPLLLIAAGKTRLMLAWGLGGGLLGYGLCYLMLSDSATVQWDLPLPGVYFGIPLGVFAIALIQALRSGPPPDRLLE